MGPQADWLPDGRRLHLNHGPIDLIVEAFGDPAECAAAYGQAMDRFETVLNELVAELAELRRPAGAARRVFAGTTACRMEAAACLFAESFITPMAAVAGAVADEILAAMVAGRELDRAYVNDGGDIAIFLAPGAEIKAAIAGGGFANRVTIRHADAVRGIATSGWRGRSHSLGIADAVTVLARDAATADAAATLIANAVDLPGHPAIERKPANELAPDSDLGWRLVTVGVGELSSDEVERALMNGFVVVEDFVRRGHIAGAALFLAGRSLQTGSMAPSLTSAKQPSRLALPHMEEGDSAARVTPSSPLWGRARGGGAKERNRSTCFGEGQIADHQEHRQGGGDDGMERGGRDRIGRGTHA